MLDGDAEVDRVLHNLTGADLPSSALSSVTADRDWLVQMGVEMLNRGGFPQIQGPECDPGVAQSWSPAILAEEPPQPIPSHLVRILVRDETFRPARMRLARDWEMSSPCYESALIPSVAHVGPVDYRVRGAWCVMRVCVLQVPVHSRTSVPWYCAVVLLEERRSSIASRPPRPCISPDGPESAGTPASAYCNPFHHQ